MPKFHNHNTSHPTHALWETELNKYMYVNELRNISRSLLSSTKPQLAYQHNITEGHFCKNKSNQFSQNIVSNSVG